MRKPLLLLLVAALMVGGFQSSRAGHDGGAKVGKPHEPIPTPKSVTVQTVCTFFEAPWTITNAMGGITPADPNHNHYTLTESTTCTNFVPGVGAIPQGDYTFSASGGTDGPCGGQIDSGKHGECALAGWSHQSGYTGASVACDAEAAPKNKNDVSMTHTGPGTVSRGWMKFKRAKDVLTLWGCLDFPGGKKHFFGTFTWAKSPTDLAAKPKNFFVTGTLKLGP